MGGLADGFMGMGGPLGPSSSQQGMMGMAQQSAFSQQLALAQQQAANNEAFNRAMHAAMTQAPNWNPLSQMLGGARQEDLAKVCPPPKRPDSPYHEMAAKMREMGLKNIDRYIKNVIDTKSDVAAQIRTLKPGAIIKVDNEGYAAPPRPISNIDKLRAEVREWTRRAA